jgi:hypothetical protein
MNDTPIPATPEWYRAQARRFTHLAAIAILPHIKQQLMAIAGEYEENARQVHSGKLEKPGQSG